MGKMLGGDEEKDPDAAKKEEERQEALRQEEEERKAKYAKMEAEREAMRQGIRDKVWTAGRGAGAGGGTRWDDTPTLQIAVPSLGAGYGGPSWLWTEGGSLAGATWNLFLPLLSARLHCTDLRMVPSGGSLHPRCPYLPHRLSRD